MKKTNRKVKTTRKTTKPKKISDIELLVMAMDGLELASVCFHRIKNTINKPFIYMLVSMESYIKTHLLKEKKPQKNEGNK